MRPNLNHLLVVVGVILVSTSLFSAGMDLRRVLLSLTSEQREITAIQEVKLRRSLLVKRWTTPPIMAETSLQGSLNLSVAETGVPGEKTSKTVTRTTAKGDELVEGDLPERIVIPAIGLDAPVLPAETILIKKGGQDYQQWLPPNERAAGWHTSSALLGQPGNTVMNGHHNIYGKVFARLIDLDPGDLIVVFGSQRAFVYEITNKMLLREKYQALDVRMDNARWILPSDDERLTLVTCWPPETNTHRLIIVARPLGSGP